ncbi:ATP-binding protein [Streptomyces avidinii]
MGRDRAASLLADALPAVPAAGRALGDAPAVLTYFLERSGLLRAPTEDTVEFVHRTFQDFLGARAALDEGGLGELTRHADDDQWEDVIRMAVAQGRPLERAAVIGSLLLRDSDRAVLLAFASLEYAAELEPELREDVRRAARRLIPPKDVEAARALGRIGPLILDLLPRGENARGKDALLSVIAAEATGSEEAVGYLAGYCRHPDGQVQEALVRGWRRFGSRRYAAEVLARMVPPPRGVVIESDEELAALTGFTAPPDLRVGHKVTRDALARFLGRRQVSGLTFRSFPGKDHAGFLHGQDSLRRLTINNWAELRDLRGLHGLPVEEVVLHLGNREPLGPVLASWPRLRSLTLHEGHGPWSFHDFSPEARPEELELPGADPDLAGLGRLRSLRRLWLGYAWRPGADSAWTELSALEELRELAVHTEAMAGLAASARLPSLRSLLVYDDDEAWDPALRARVARSFPRAELGLVPQTYDI